MEDAASVVSRGKQPGPGPMSDFDSPWKEAIDEHLPLFLALLTPEVEEDYDWKRDVESLDVELRQLAAGSEVGKRLADKLLKLWTKGGDERYLHVEVQAQPQEGFERRVFVYQYRGDDRFGLPMEEIIILADDDPDWRPSRYVVELKRTRLVFEFKPVKVLDWASREAELASSPNLAALFVLAHLKSRQTRHDEMSRARAKLALILELMGRKLDPEVMRKWYRWLDWLLDLPPEVDREMWLQVSRQDKEKNMPYVTFAERYGMEKGLEQGRKEGERLGLLKGLRGMLKLKFGEAGEALMPELERQDDPATLRSVTDAVESAASPDDLRRLLPPTANGAAT
jgi:hypothetical protein